MRIKQDAVAGPTSSAGLVRYFDISGGGVEITPELVLGISIFLIVVEVILWFVL